MKVTESQIKSSTAPKKGLILYIKVSIRMLCTHIKSMIFLKYMV